jgi:hypothetical protein
LEWGDCVRQPPDSLAAEPLGELYFRLTQLTREVEYLHGMRGQEPAPWLLLCRDSDLFNTDGYADRPTSYDKVYVDLMQAYRNAARTAMSVADRMGRAAPPPPRMHWRWLGGLDGGRDPLAVAAS